MEAEMKKYLALFAAICLDAVSILFQWGPYVGNSNTKIFHESGCPYVRYIQPVHRVTFMYKDQALRQGYRPCGHCRP